MAVALLWFALVPVTVAVNATNRPPGPLGPATPASYGLTYQHLAGHGWLPRGIGGA